MILGALLNKRKFIKRQITRLESTVLVAGNPHILVPLTENAVILYEEKVKKLAIDLDAIQELLPGKCKPEDVDVHIKEYDALIHRIESLQILLQNARSQLTAASATLLPRSTPTSDLRLPPIDLPKFGGNRLEWLSFHDLFLATIHNNSALSGAQKLHYLKNSTYNDAGRLIHSLQLTDGNYQEAWDILTSRYNNPREIAEAHAKRLFSQAAVKEASSVAIRQVIGTTSECVRSLKVLQVPVQHWDMVLLHIVKDKLDPESRHQWELSLTGTGFPTYDELALFLERRARSLEASQPTVGSSRSRSSSDHKQPRASSHVTTKKSCVACSESHDLFKCPKFIQASTEERWSLVKKHCLCFNCLHPDHRSNECKWGTCRHCSSKHHSSLHRPSPETADANPEVKTCMSQERSSLSLKGNNKAQVLIPTAMILVRAATGHFKPLRALLDSASQASFITERGVRLLQLKRTRFNISIGGIGATGVGTARGSVLLAIRTNRNAAISVEALILKAVTGNLPNRSFDPSHLSHTKGLALADKTFHVSGPVDILLGADVYFDVVTEGRIKRKGTLPVAFKTQFGWAVGGPLNPCQRISSQSSIQVHTCTLDVQLARFWAF